MQKKISKLFFKANQLKCIVFFLWIWAMGGRETEKTLN